MSYFKTIAIDQTTPGTTNGVQVNAALPAGTNVIGHVIVDSGAVTATVSGVATASKQDTGNTSVASIDTKTPALGQALAAASVPVVLTSAQISTLTPLATVAATQSGTWTVQPGNTPNTTPWLVTVGHGKTIKSLSGSFTADTDIIAAVTSKRIKVIGYAFFTFGTSANLILLKTNGTGGTLLWTVTLQATTGATFGANMAVSAPSFIFATAAGEKLTADVNQSDTIYWSISYFDDDAS